MPAHRSFELSTALPIDEARERIDANRRRDHLVRITRTDDDVRAFVTGRNLELPTRVRARLAEGDEGGTLVSVRTAPSLLVTGILVGVCLAAVPVAGFVGLPGRLLVVAMLGTAFSSWWRARRASQERAEEAKETLRAILRTSRRHRSGARRRR